MLARAGERAASLAAAAEARRYFEQAAELTADPSLRAELLGSAGEMAQESRRSRRGAPAARGVDRAARATGRHARGRARARDARRGRLVHRQARRGARRGWSVPSPSSRATSPTRVWRCSRRGCRGGTGSAAISSVRASAPSSPSTSPRRTRLPDGSRAGAAGEGGGRLQPWAHAEESTRCSGTRCEIALDHELVDDAGICYFLLSDGCFRRDQYVEALGYLDEALALSRKLGDRPYEWASLAERTYALYMLGRWDEAQAVGEEFTAEQLEAGGVMLSLLQTGVEIHVQRGELDEARRVFAMFGTARGVDAMSRTEPSISACAPASAGRRAGCGRRSPTARRRSRRDAHSASRSRP